MNSTPYFLTSANDRFFSHDSKLITSEEYFYDVLKEKYKITRLPRLNGYTTVDEVALDYFDRITNNLVEDIGGRLGIFFKCNYDQEQWHFILYYFLHLIVASCFELYNKVEYPLISGCRVIGLKKRRKILYDFCEYPFADDEFVCFIYSTICENYGMRIDRRLLFHKRNRVILLEFLRKIKYVIFRLYYSVKHLFSGGMCKCFDRIDCNSLLINTRFPIDIQDYLENLDSVKGFAEQNFRKYSLQACFASPYRKRLRWRIFFRNWRQSEDDFYNVCYKTAVEYLPIPLVEKFECISRTASSISSLIQVKKVYSSASVGFSQCVLENIVGAILKKRGVSVINIQHAFGEAYSSILSNMVYGIGFTKYYTWGIPIKPDKAEQRCISRIPGYYKRSEKSHKMCKRILIVCFPERTNYNYYEGSVVERVVNTCSLLDSLKADLRFEIVLRLKSDVNAFFCKTIKARFPYLRFETQQQQSFYDSVMESALVICEYLGSSFVESIIYGRPTILHEAIPCIPRNQLMCKELDILSGEGVYYDHNSANKLADFINYSDSFDIWWKAKKNTISSFMERTVGNYSDAEDIWKSEILGYEVF